MNEPEEENGDVQIKLNDQWEIIVHEQSGTISIAAVHGEDRYVLAVGCLGCAGLPNAAVLEEGINIIRSAGHSAAKPN